MTTRAGWPPVPLGLVAAAVLLVLVPGDTEGQGYARSVPPQGIHIGRPPADLVDVGPTPRWSKTFPSGRTVGARLTYHLHFKLVEIGWSLGGESQVIRLPYWPTDAIWMSESKLLVAGKMPRGETVIETIELLEFDAVTGEPTQIPAPVGRRETLYFESTVGRDMVVWFGLVQGCESEVHVRFHDSGDVYRLDVASRELTLQASALAGMGVPHVPLLSATWSETWSGDHEALGHVYVLAEYACPTSVVLIDSDRDGQVDSHLVANEAVWVAHGLGKVESYVGR